jgi:metacaspase-1
MDSTIQQSIPAKFVMISGSEDNQTSADVFNVNSFQLPDPAGKAGGACTSTLLRVLHDQRGKPMSWIDLLHKMRDVLRQKGYDQVPQLSSSRMLDVNHTFEIVPPESVRNGARRALLIGINYVGQQGQLSGCHNDVKNIKKYLIKHQGFQEKDMLILMDDGRHHQPTRANIMNAFDRVSKYSKAGDVVFIHYSGHGGRVRDTSGDEADGYDEVSTESEGRTVH